MLSESWRPSLQRAHKHIPPRLSLFITALHAQTTTKEERERAEWRGFRNGKKERGEKWQREKRETELKGGLKRRISGNKRMRGSRTNGRRNETSGGEETGGIAALGGNEREEKAGGGFYHQAVGRSLCDIVGPSGSPWKQKSTCLRRNAFINAL